MNNGTDKNGVNAVAPPPQSYLGPVILAAKDRPVRVLFKNLLPTGAGGNLFIPVDSTYMGADGPDNRATLHLHGGATPWISDGTPHQWTTPIGDPTPLKGVSTQSVPDMYFDGFGNIVPFCTTSVSTNCYPNGTFTGTLPAGATNNAPNGEMTFYWTNQQGGRLMFYHDHAYGITRLNVSVVRSR
jgi:FtsP/CotA-like multicopper oxidase with cupredoxin domain